MSEFYTHVTTNRGNILYRGIINGKRVQDKVADWQPYLFLPTNQSSPTSYRTLDNKPVIQKRFNSISSAKDFIRTHKDVDGFEFFGMTNFEYLYINDLFPGEIKFLRKYISIVSIDIEVASLNGFPDPKLANEEIQLITLRKNNKAYMFGTKVYHPKNPENSYYLCKNEIDLITKFLAKWEELDPDIVIGWNSNGFDIPYIINRILKLFNEDVAKRLSPWRIINQREIPTSWGEPRIEYTLVGIATLDYIDLYKKFSYKNQESYRLDHIAFVELGENKLDYSDYIDLNDLYDKNFELFADYNLHDTVLVDKLDEKLGYINIILFLSYLYKCNYEDVLATVKPWDVCIHHILLAQGIVIPQNKYAIANRSLPGGYVKDVIPGKYDWVISVDIKSSYPHQVLQYNISPETYLGKLPFISVEDLLNNRLEENRQFIDENNVSVAGNMTYYSKHKKGFLPQIMDAFFQRRSDAENKLKELKEEFNKNKNNEIKNQISQYDSMQMAIKIAINSLYGAIANEHCRWFSIDLAEAITLSGQLAIKWVEKRINLYLNNLLKTENVDYVIAADTDSNYVNLNDIVLKLNLNDDLKISASLDRFFKEHLSKVITKAFEDLAVYMNAFENRIRMDRENIASSSIWTAKKHYVMNVIDSKGTIYKEPKLKIVGLEAIKQTIPMVCKEKIKPSMKLLMEGTNSDIVEYVSNFEKEFKKLPASQVSSPRGVSNVTKYQDRMNIYSKGTPLHVRGALLYNHYVKSLNLENKYQLIRDGSKIRYMYLKLPNPIKENVIAFIDELPEEFGLNGYIDYSLQFDKCFKSPLKQLADVIGWNLDNSVNFEDFFK